MISKNNYNLDWNYFFYNDPHSPSGLRWKTVSEKSYSVKNGDIAGTKQYRKNGEPSKWMVKIRGKNYSCAKIVFIMAYGYVENNILIDHIDTDPFNNKIENLRATIEPLNLKNKKYQNNNSSGFTGVSVIVKKGVKYYVATWIENGKQRGKSFNTSKLGEICSKLSAVCFRYEKLKEVDAHGDYSQQHYNIDDTTYELFKEAINKIQDVNQKLDFKR